MAESSNDRSKKRGIGLLTYREIGGLLLALVVLVFIVVNREQTEISFIFFSARTAVWIALAVAGLGGFLAGLLVGRRRYR